ncbi:MAG: DUF2460 domain-containing protein [Rickettsiaceae bacterium]|nr:DUF2460 domain-containing protein [Rickettsiaceae bacterium]
MHHDSFLPNFLDPFITISFGFESVVHKSISGRNYIRNNTDASVHNFLIKSPKLSKKEFEEFYGFFNARGGPLNSFNLVLQGDSTLPKTLVQSSFFVNQNEFKIFKQYGDGQNIFFRQLKHIDISSLKIYVNGDEKPFDYDTQSQIVTIDPKFSGKNIEVECSFYWRVRFDSKKIEYSHSRDGAYLLCDILLTETE